MNSMDRERLAESLDLDLEGQLDRAESAALEKRLESDPELAAEKRLLVSLHALLRESRIRVRPGFREQVTAGLPAAAWHRARVPVWVLPLAMTAVLAVASALVLGSAAPAAGGPLSGTGMAVLDFLKVTALAGAGLAAASWQGFGLVLGELFAASGLNLVAVAILVLFLDLLFISMLSRRPAAEVLPILERDARDGPEPAEGD